MPTAFGTVTAARGRRHDERDGRALVRLRAAGRPLLEHPARSRVADAARDLRLEAVLLESRHGRGDAADRRPGVTVALSARVKYQIPRPIEDEQQDRRDDPRPPVPRADDGRLLQAVEFAHDGAVGAHADALLLVHGARRHAGVGRHDHALLPNDALHRPLHERGVRGTGRHSFGRCALIAHGPLPTHIKRIKSQTSRTAAGRIATGRERRRLRAADAASRPG